MWQNKVIPKDLSVSNVYWALGYLFLLNENLQTEIRWRAVLLQNPQFRTHL